MTRLALIGITVCALLALCPAQMAAAQSLDPGWWSVDAGGTYAVSGGYTLGATLGQPDAGTVSGGWYTLRGGYWPGATVRHVTVYVPMNGGWLRINRQFTYGQLTIVAAALVLAAIWLRRGRRTTA